MAVSDSNNWMTFGVLLVVLICAIALMYYCMSGKNSTVNEEYVNHDGDENEYETYVNSHPSYAEADAFADETVSVFESQQNTNDVTKASEDVEISQNSNETAQPMGTDDGSTNAPLPKDCFPKDQLTPAELLPGDANSTWAQVNPAGQGSLGDQNFLNAGFHVGINTVGQTLRNANLQLRSEPPNPQVKVSPWLQTTIEPDTNRKPLEIGGI